ncbi:ABC transporter permease [Dongia deserti]|uniref:ABC transporter permease n=1 Tax=Dongia deserti TaxID=2268030 RepID=UPI0013C4B60B|nr:ABC transporter permease subunit [Dongia deserti]
MRARIAWLALVAVPGVAILAGLVFVLLPAFGYFPALGGTSLSLQPWRDLLAYPGLGSAARATLISALVAMPIALGLALLALAWIAPLGRARTGLPLLAAKFLSWLLATPHAAFALGLAFLIAPSGWLVRIAARVLPIETPPDLLVPHDPYGLSLAAGLVLKEMPFLFFAALTALNQLDAPRMMAIGASLGYQPGLAWFKLIAPRLYALIRLPVYAALAYSLSAVDMALVLGPAAPPTLALLAVDLTHDPDLARRFPAAALALAHLALTLMALGIWRACELFVARALRTLLADGVRSPTLIWRWSAQAGRALAGLGIVFGALAILALPLWSLAATWRFPKALPDCCALAAWQRALPDLWLPFRHSLSIALFVTLLALIGAIAWLQLERFVTHRTRLKGRTIAALPLIVSDVAFLMGVQILLLGLGLVGGWLPTALSHTLFVFPYVLLALADPWARLDPRYERSALCLGASPLRVLVSVRLPLLLPALVFAAALGCAVSLSLYLPTILMGGGRITTLATEAIALSSGGDRRIVGVYGTTLALVIWAGFFAAYWIARRAARPALT